MTGGLGFLNGGGRAADLILARDWSGHVLGPPEGWSEGLKVALSLVVNSPESMILCWGPDLTFFFNETYFPLLGPRLGWAMGARFDEVWADAWEQAKPIIDEAFAGGSRRFTDLPWKLDTDRGQADTWFTFSYSRVLDPDGAVAGLFIFTNETTDRVLADAALRESSERLRLVIQGARDHAILTTDPAGTITDWSSGAEAILGWSAEEAVGRSASMIYTPEDRAGGVDAAEREGAARQGSASEERWHVTRTGARVFLNGSVHPLPPDAQGVERGFLMIARDDTERWRARQALETLNAGLELQVAERTADRNRLWQLSSDIMLVAALDGTIEAVNPAWTRVLGWAADELIGRPLFAFVHPDDLEHTATGAAAIAEGEYHARFENRYRHKDGSYRDIVWAAGPGDDKMIAVGRDSTEERARERDLAAVEEALRQSQKMEAVGQLTGGLAHDFNNLLTAVTGGLDLLQHRLAQGRQDGVERYIAMAKAGADRAAALTQRLLAFSRRQTLAPTPTDVDRLVAGMEDIVARSIGPAIDVRVVATAGLWPVLVDAPQLENALLNLCINARDAMPEGGRLTIETGNKPLDARAAAAQDLPAGEYVSLCVTDTGTGMTPETIARVFDPFFTTKPIGEGTGLGLSMIYGFVRQSGGQVRVYSELGEGTTMCLYLPRHLGDAEDIGTATPDEARRTATDRTVLLVEDEAAIRELVREILEEAGYRVLEAPTGPAGVRMLQGAERIDLLITDVGLPGGLNGRQVADAGRAVRPELKVLFVTGYAANAAIGAGHLEAGMEVLTKPFNMLDLERRVHTLLGV